VRIRIKACADGAYYLGSVEMRTSVPGAVVAAAVGEDMTEALSKAALVAERIASDPVMRALMPPEMEPAIQAAKALAAAARRGPTALRSFMRSLRGPGARRLAATLHTEVSGSNRGDWILARYGDWDRWSDEQLGVLPALLVAKYGPGGYRAARKAKAAHSMRKRRRKREREREKEEQEQEPEPEPEAEPEAEPQAEPQQ